MGWNIKNKSVDDVRTLEDNIFDVAARSTQRIVNDIRIYTQEKINGSGKNRTVHSTDAKRCGNDPEGTSREIANQR